MKDTLCRAPDALTICMVTSKQLVNDATILLFLLLLIYEETTHRGRLHSFPAHAVCAKLASWWLGLEVRTDRPTPHRHRSASSALTKLHTLGGFSHQKRLLSLFQRLEVHD